MKPLTVRTLSSACLNSSTTLDSRLFSFSHLFCWHAVKTMESTVRLKMVVIDQRKQQLFHPHQPSTAPSQQPPETLSTDTTIHAWDGPAPGSGHTIELTNDKTSTHELIRDSTHSTPMVSIGVHSKVPSLDGTRPISVKALHPGALFMKIRKKSRIFCDITYDNPQLTRDSTLILISSIASHRSRKSIRTTDISRLPHGPLGWKSRC